MKLLAIDTSESVARWVGVTDEGPLEPRELQAGKKHDTLLAPGVRAWLDEQGWEKPDAVAVVHGPGGFTGLRVGVAFATGLAEAWGVKVVPVSLYERLAAMVEEGLVWAVAWGGRDDVRARLMQAGDHPTALSDVTSCSIHDLTPPDSEGKIVPLGEGYQRNRQVIDSLLGERLLKDGEVRPAALALAFAAKAAYDRGTLVPPTDVDVDYGAEFVPTPKKKAKD